MHANAEGATVAVRPLQAGASFDQSKQEETMAYRSFSSVTALAAAVVALSLAAALPASAQASDPFEALKGEWKGGGTVTPMGGDPVPVACKVTYDLSGESLAQNLRCAGEDTTIKTETKMTDKGGKVSGSWYEKSYDRTGGLNGTATDRTIHARAHEHQPHRQGPHHQHHAARQGLRNLPSGRKPRPEPVGLSNGPSSLFPSLIRSA
jgi:hypothetical protein